MIDFMGNPSSIHSEGRRCRVAIENARDEIAEYINVKPSEIVFTSGASEANNTILQGVFHANPDINFIVSPLEHPSVLKPIDTLKLSNDQVVFVKHDENGQFDMQHIEKVLSQKKKSKNILVLMHGHNELGNLIPLKKAGELCKQNDAYFFSDMVQSIGKYRINLDTINIDFATASAHKFHGPRGIGFMFIRNSSGLKPLIHGGSQERNMRAGTENLPAILGMAKALEIAKRKTDIIVEQLQQLKEYFIDHIKKEFSEFSFFGCPESGGLPHIVNLAVPKYLSIEKIIYQLDEAGISISSGSACASGAYKTSAVIGRLRQSESYNSIRVSFSQENSKQEIDAFCKELKLICYATKKESQA